MNKEPIFLQAVFKEKIWGGQALRDQFAYDIPSDHTGEAWVISGHAHGANTVMSGTYAGQTLDQLWTNSPELFNQDEAAQSAYPLLVKILDANDDLSVQVHPDDNYARQVEGVPYGKTECWYVLSATDDAQIILGHHAQTKAEFDRYIDQGEWGQLLHYEKVKAGDFFYVPSGTIHAIGKGITILEIQQSSDTTYRVYDYDRTDDDGKKRELHLDKAKAVTTIPHDFSSTDADEKVMAYANITMKQLIEAKYFTVSHWTLHGEAPLTNDADFLQVNVLEGQAVLKIGKGTYKIKKGDHFILPHDVKTYSLSGQAELMVSHP